MNAVDVASLPLWAALAFCVLMGVGGLITLIGALGLMRLPSFYQRAHGPAITVTLGAGCLLLASMLYFTLLQERWVLHELLITMFVLMTAPVVSMMVMRAAVYRDLQSGRSDRGAGAGDVYRFPDPSSQASAAGRTADSAGEDSAHR